ncbi:MAG: GDSL family lipase [Cohnella sp.]|nr:GDSL family lipase [Cohnella sp.]
MLAMEPLKAYSLSDIRHLKAHGRTTGRLDPLTLFWTGSGMELNARGSELWLEVEVAYEHYEPWIAIVINGVTVSRLMLTAGRYWLCLFRGMNKEVVKNVRIVKETQAMSGDPLCALHCHAVKFDGEFLLVPDKPYRIEFIGDSITSGEGAIGAKAEEDWIPMWFSAIDNYSALAANALNADYRVVSQSGWGVRTSWDNNPSYNIPDCYEQVCGLLTGDKNAAFGAFEPYDFDSWQPDLVVVNLGTNDGAACRNEDGTYNLEGISAFERSAERFLHKLRRRNKHAHIVWAYGMLGTPMLPAIRRAVTAYSNESGDRKVTVLELPDLTQETVGARSHPGRLAHERAAETLANSLRAILDDLPENKPQ